MRNNVTGRYWQHSEMEEVAGRYGVEVVRRFTQLEGLALWDVIDRVKGWKGREGVVVKFSDDTMAKVKSLWWIHSGFTLERRQASVTWRQAEKQRLNRRQGRMKTRGQRMAIIGLQNAVRAREVFEQFPKANKTEMIYDVSGRLRVVIVSFLYAEERLEAQNKAKQIGWKAKQAYSNRTHIVSNIRIKRFMKPDI